MTTAESILGIGWLIWTEAAELTILIRKGKQQPDGAHSVALRAKDRRGHTIETVEASDLDSLMKTVKRRAREAELPVKSSDETGFP